MYSLGSAAQYKTIRWYIDGVLQTSANDSATFSLSTRGRTTGMNEILVVVTDANDMIASSSTRLNILPGSSSAEIRVRNAVELAMALESIGASSEAETTIYVCNNFSTPPISLGPQFAGKKIILAADNGEKTISLGSQGSMFTVSKNVSVLIDKGVTLEGIGEKGNNSPLVKVLGGEVIVKGVLKNNGCSLLKNRNYPLAVGGVYAEDARISLNGGVIEGTHADHWLSYETYLGGNITAVGGIYAKNSVIELINGAVIQETESDIMDSPSFAAGGLYLDGSTAIISNSAIKNCKAGSYNFTSYSAGAVFIAENSRLTLQEGSLIAGNRTHVSDLYNQAAGTILVNGQLDMNGGIIEQNTLWYAHRYTFSHTYGSAGVYIGPQAVFNKTQGLVCGTDSPVANQCVSGDTQVRGTIRVAAAAYYAATDSCVNSSF
jgi:hypothetical protein